MAKKSVSNPKKVKKQNPKATVHPIQYNTGSQIVILSPPGAKGKVLPS